MNVIKTLDLLECAANLSAEPEPIRLLRNDIIQSVKFDLGDEFSGMPGFQMAETRIPAPKLPYEKVYFEAVSSDGLKHGAIFENFQGCGVCGQMLTEGRVSGCKDNGGLFPAFVMFTQKGEDLQIHPDKSLGIKDVQVDAIVALDLMVKAMAVLNCSNVTTKDTTAPERLNKKRIKRGKLPFFTYKTLHIKAPGVKRRKQTGGGSHASPRVHLRRGHIRHLRNGKDVWVQPCIVGDKEKGVIAKDYSVSPNDA